MPSPFPPKLKQDLKDWGLDLDDPNVLAAIQACTLDFDGSLTLTNASGSIGQCTERKKKK